jgi:hypothetical protein
MQVEELPSSQAEVISVLGAIQLISVTPAIRQEMGLQADVGALIREISDAATRTTNLRTGDVILQINMTVVASVEDAQRAFRDVAGRGAVRVFFSRGGARGVTDFYVRTR